MPSGRMEERQGVQTQHRPHRSLVIVAGIDDRRYDVLGMLRQHLFVTDMCGGGG